MVAPLPHRRPASVITPEAVVLELEPAGIASRLLAKLMDLVVMVLGLSALLQVGVFLLVADDGAGAVILAVIAGFIAIFGYWFASETLLRGRTVGKMALGLRVVTVDGGPVRFRHAFLRALLGFVDFVIPPGGAVGMAAALLTPRGQRLGDLAAGTIVIRDRHAAGYVAAVDFFDPGRQWDPYVSQLDVSAMTEADYGLVRRYLLRAGALSFDARTSLANELDRYLQQQLRLTRPPQLHPEWFLHCVGLAYQRRAA